MGNHRIIVKHTINTPQFSTTALYIFVNFFSQNLLNTLLNVSSVSCVTDSSKMWSLCFFMLVCYYFKYIIIYKFPFGLLVFELIISKNVNFCEISSGVLSEQRFNFRTKWERLLVNIKSKDLKLKDLCSRNMFIFQPMSNSEGVILPVQFSFILFQSWFFTIDIVTEEFYRDPDIHLDPEWASQGWR